MAATWRALTVPPDPLPNASSGSPRETRIALTVADFDQPLAIYRDGLGLALVEDWTTGETGRSVVLAAGRASLELLDERAAYTDQVEIGARVTSQARLAFEVGNVADAVASLQARGGASLHAPVHASWGTLTQRLQAPDCMQISLCQMDDPDKALT